MVLVLNSLFSGALQSVSLCLAFLTASRLQLGRRRPAPELQDPQSLSTRLFGEAVWTKVSCQSLEPYFVRLMWLTTPIAIKQRLLLLLQMQVWWRDRITNLISNSMLPILATSFVWYVFRRLRLALKGPTYWIMDPHAPVKSGGFELRSQKGRYA